MTKHAPRLQEHLTDAQGRIRRSLSGECNSPRATSNEERLLFLAHKKVDRTIWLRKTLPLNLLFAVPGILIGATQSSHVLFLLIATFPLVLVVRAILARILSNCIGPRELLLRRELERLSSSRLARQSESNERTP